MIVIKWLAIAIGVGLTLVWVGVSISNMVAGEEPIGAWLNEWTAGPMVLFFVLLISSTISRAVGGIYAGKSGAAFRGAPIAVGTLVSVERTGLTVNDQPQLDLLLDVETVDGQSFRAVARQIVDITELSMLEPGTLVPVRYIPGSSDRKVVLAKDGNLDEIQAVTNRVRLAKGLITPTQLRVAEEGIEGQAVVLAMAATGEIRDGRAVVSLTLRVTRKDSTFFDVTQE